MIMRPPPLRAISFKTISRLLFVFLTFLIFSNSYADKIYTVQANDFLGKIVKRNYALDSNITKEQVMTAILRANPDAFRGGNIHFLKRVDSLTLPSTEAVALISQTEALQTIRKHYTFFKRNKTGNFPPIPLKRPSEESTTTKTEKETTTTEENTEKTEGFSSLSELTDNTTDTEQATTTEENTEKTEGFSSLSELTDNTADTEQATTTEENTEKTEGFSSLSELTDNTADTEQANTEQTEGFSSLSELTDNTPKTEEISSLNDLEKQQQTTILKNEKIQELEKRKEEQNTTLNQLDNKIKKLEENLTNPSQTKNEKVTTTEKNASPSSSTSPLILWLLLPIFALFSILWWRKKPKIQPIDSIQNESNVKRDQTIFHKPTMPKKASATIQKISVNSPVKKANLKEKSATATAPPLDENINESNAQEKETAIKLDMARAYQDMGYPEEAKEILEEVINEGTTQQKEMAEGLLAVL